MGNKLIFETSDDEYIKLIAHKNEIFCLLYDLKEWHRLLINGKDYENDFIIQGKKYSYAEILTNEFKNDKNIKRDEHGFLIDCYESYSREYITDKLNQIMDKLWHFVD